MKNKIFGTLLQKLADAANYRYCFLKSNLFWTNNLKSPAQTYRKSVNFKMITTNKSGRFHRCFVVFFFGRRFPGINEYLQKSEKNNSSSMYKILGTRQILDPP